MGITLYKTEKGRWDSLLYTGENAKNKPGNMIVWWDLIEKYEEELDNWTKPQPPPKPTEDTDS